MQNVLDIIIWYKNNLRDLPWRSTKDPYKIWLAEVILQQTQVSQGLGYYHAFLSEYPDIIALAAADEQEVLKMWQGLGYYSRARNLIKTAKIIHQKYQNKFPSDINSLLALPGIGEYTASAILSFAYRLSYPTLDGNVYRVLSRLYDIHLPVNIGKNKKAFMDILQEMIQFADPCDFNNAMMELGATVCKPDNPACNLCPLSSGCLARINGTIHQLPYKIPKSPRKKRYFNFFLIRYQGCLYIEKRLSTDIWQHMYQLPLIESQATIGDFELTEIFKETITTESTFVIGQKKSIKHILTHQEIYASFTELIFSEKPTFSNPGIIAVNARDLVKYPMPVLVEKFLVSL